MDNVLTPDKPVQARCDAGFFGQFPQGGIAGRLAGFNMPAGQAPEPVSGLLGPLGQQYLAIAQRHGTDARDRFYSRN